VPQILFKKEFHAAILAGRKTTTLRRWRACKLKPGDRVRVPGVGELTLSAVESVQWADLTEADAKADGFESLAELNKVIARIYPNMADDGKAWFRIRFGAPKPTPMAQLAAAVRAELDKAVRKSRSLPAQ
jgi:hypothetical protein